MELLAKLDNKENFQPAEIAGDAAGVAVAATGATRAVLRQVSATCDQLCFDSLVCVA